MRHPWKQAFLDHVSRAAVTRPKPFAIYTRPLADGRVEHALVDATGSTVTYFAHSGTSCSECCDSMPHLIRAQVRANSLGPMAGN